MSAFEQMMAVVDRPQSLPGINNSSFWRKEPPIIVDGKVIKGGMFQPQLEWWNLPNRTKVFVAGYGAGKSHLVAGKRAISSALTNAPAPVAVVSPSYPFAKKTVVPTISELLEGKRSIYGREFWWSYNQSSPPTFTIRFHGREAKIQVYSGEKPLSLRGSNLAAAYIDEPFIQDKEVYQQMNARVRHPDAQLIEIGLAGTPEQLNWGYDLCTNGEEFQDVDVGVVHASTRSNLALRHTYADDLEAVYDERASKAYVEGQFVNLAKGQVYYGFNPQENVAHLDRPAGSELGAGMDFNVNPMAFCAFWILGDHMHVFKEYELANSDTEYAAGLLKEHYHDLYEVYPDATGSNRSTKAPGAKSDFDYLKKAGLHINVKLTATGAPANPERRDRYNAVNGKFKPRNGIVTLTVEPSCKKLIKYLSVYAHEILNKPEQVAMSHLLDAFSYAVAYRYPVTRHQLVLQKVMGA